LRLLIGEQDRRVMPTSRGGAWSRPWMRLVLAESRPRQRARVSWQRRARTPRWTVRATRRQRQRMSTRRRSSHGRRARDGATLVRWRPTQVQGCPGTAAAVAGRTPCGVCRRRRGMRRLPDSRAERLQTKPGCQADSSARRRRATGARGLRDIRLRLPRRRRRRYNLRRSRGQRPLPSPSHSLGLPLPIMASSKGGRCSSTSA